MFNKTNMFDYTNVIVLNCLFRDLGTSLTNLRTLWLSRSGLSDLDGISSVSSLKVLKQLLRPKAEYSFHPRSFFFIIFFCVAMTIYGMCFICGLAWSSCLSRSFKPVQCFSSCTIKGCTLIAFRIEEN